MFWYVGDGMQHVEGGAGSGLAWDPPIVVIWYVTPLGEGGTSQARDPPVAAVTMVTIRLQVF